jgi:hypothetical protein
MTKRKRAKQQTNEEHMLLWPLIDQAEQGEDELVKYLLHCGITADDIGEAGDVQRAILEHYRRPDGTYAIDAAAHDLLRWPPIAARIKQHKRSSSLRSGLPTSQ